MRSLPYFLALLLAPALAACVGHPTDAELLQGDVVLTHFDGSRQFSAYRTFALPADLPLIIETDIGGRRVVRLAAPDIIGALRSQLVARGFTEVAEGQGQPDLAVGISALSSTTSIYAGEQCSAWVTWYFTSTCVSSYAAYDSQETRTVVIDVADIKPRPGQVGPRPAEIIWSTWIYGALSEENELDHQKVVEGITDGFAQSPYFATTGGTAP